MDYLCSNCSRISTQIGSLHPTDDRNINVRKHFNHDDDRYITDILYQDIEVTKTCSLCRLLLKDLERSDRHSLLLNGEEVDASNKQLKLFLCSTDIGSRWPRTWRLRLKPTNSEGIHCVVPFKIGEPVRSTHIGQGTYWLVC